MVCTLYRDCGSGAGWACCGTNGGSMPGGEELAGGATPTGEPLAGAYGLLADVGTTALVDGAAGDGELGAAAYGEFTTGDEAAEVGGGARVG